MEIVYTRHAEKQIKERKIQKVWVEETAKFPDVTNRVGHKYYAIKKLNGITLKVVYVKENYLKITTSYIIT